MYTKKVLVVASNPRTRGAIGDALRSGGYGVYEATNRPEALERASLDMPGLILVDLNLTDELDGWTTVKLLGESPRTEGIPVVLVSDAEKDGDLRRASLLGCRAVVRDSDPAAAVAAARAILGTPQTQVPPATPPGVIRRRYRPRSVPAA